MQCSGQGPLLITFDGPPSLASGSAVLVQSYYESGLVFQPIGIPGPGNTFGRVASNPNPARPDNGTAYLQAGLGSTLMFGSTNGFLFDLLSVDLAEYSTVVPNAVTVHFIGYYMDGSTVTRDITTDGIIDGTGPISDFQTFDFQGWTGLTRVEIPTFGWSLDNVRAWSIPEPTNGALLIVGGITLWLMRSRKSRHD